MRGVAVDQPMQRVKGRILPIDLHIRRANALPIFSSNIHALRYLAEAMGVYLGGDRTEYTNGQARGYIACHLGGHGALACFKEAEGEVQKLLEGVLRDGANASERV